MLLSPKVVRLASACVLAATVLSACSSSTSTKGSAGSSSASSSGSSSAPATTSSSESGTKADAVVFAAVKHAYETFFNYHTSLAVATTLIQHSTALRTLLQAQSVAARTQKPTAVVSAVTVLSSTVAKVVWTLSVGGSPTLPNTSGFAVKEGGKWKVSAQTFCALVSLAGTPPAVCSDPAVTALP